MGLLFAKPVVVVANRLRSVGERASGPNVMSGVLFLAFGAAGLGYASQMEAPDLSTVLLVCSAVLTLVAGVYALVTVFGQTYYGVFDPTQVPSGLPSEGFDLQPGVSLSSGPSFDSPASVVFDTLLQRALTPVAVSSQDLADECPATASQPSDSQLRAYLEAVMGGETLLPTVGAMVPIRVPCVIVRSCSGLGPRPLLDLEFIVIRDGDGTGVHYEAHVAADPLALLWFRRVGELPSSDAFSCTPRIRQ